MNVVAMRVARAVQSAEQQQAARERDAFNKRVARAAQSAKQQAIRERDASVRLVARAAQPVEQQQAVRERDASARRRARAARRAGKQALHTADEVEGLVVHSLGTMSHRCTHCNALRFEHEKKRTTLCCVVARCLG